MAVNVYRSTDAGAPVLTGQAGTMVTVLDACLINGYGSKSAAGWGKPYSSTNIGVYRAASGNRLYLRVDDTAAQEARIVGYEAMTTASPSSSVGSFPLPAQVSGGLFVRKSDTSDAVVRAWVLIASDKFFYFLPYSGASDPAQSTSPFSMSGQMAFGEFLSYKPGDTFNTIIISGALTGANAGALGINTRTAGFAAGPGHFVARNHLQFGNSITVCKTAILDPTTTTTLFGVSGNHPPFPDSVLGGINVSPIVVGETGHNGSYVTRGVLPGLWAPMHNSPMSHYDIVVGSGNLADKSLQMHFTSNGSSLSRLLFEISDTW
jgi:hypothetical protein